MDFDRNRRAPALAPDARYAPNVHDIALPPDDDLDGLGYEAAYPALQALVADARPAVAPARDAAD